MSARSKVVLITGCSSGIGEATARRLAGAGWTVYATARRTEAIAGLAQDGCRLLQLDVNDEASMRAAVAQIEAEHGAVGVLINNAGYSQSGAYQQRSDPACTTAQIHKTIHGPNLSKRDSADQDMA